MSISLDELQLATMACRLEALRHEITPLGLHCLLTHYDIPVVGAASWRLTIGGGVERPLLSLNDAALNIRIPQQASAAAINRETLAADDEQERRARLLPDWQRSSLGAPLQPGSTDHRG